MVHFPGRQFVEIGTEDYAQSVKTRMARLRTDLISYAFARDSIVSAITSPPRWSFIRILVTPDVRGSSSMKGLLEAKDRLESETNAISPRGNVLPEALFRRESTEIQLMLDVYR